jgi:thymidylate synthase
MIVVRGSNADLAWRRSLSHFRRLPQSHRVASDRTSVQELLHVAIDIEHPRQRWVLSRLPPMNPAFALAEVVWILSGLRSSAFINFWNPLLPRYAGDGSTYHGAYGYRLRHQLGLDQVKRAYDVLRANPHTRQVVLQIWSPTLDLPLRNATAVSPDVPCNICSMLKVRDGRLWWTQVMRSNDLVRGFPHNVVQFTYLQEMFAAWLGVGVGRYTHVADSLHIYDSDRVTPLIERSCSWPANTDSWGLDYRASMACIATMAKLMTAWRHRDSAPSILKDVVTSDLPEAQANILCVIAADAARRHRRTAMVEQLMRRCTNPALSHAWKRWHARRSQET